MKQILISSLLLSFESRILDQLQLPGRFSESCRQTYSSTGRTGFPFVNRSLMLQDEPFFFPSFFPPQRLCGGDEPRSCFRRDEPLLGAPVLFTPTLYWWEWTGSKCSSIPADVPMLWVTSKVCWVLPALFSKLWAVRWVMTFVLILTQQIVDPPSFSVYKNISVTYKP